MRKYPNKSDGTEVDYLERVNRAIDHVVQNLDQSLTLETVARIAHFSPFHFHRVFKSLIGETLNEFVKRLRLERALTLQTHDPGRSLTEIALACGFSSSSDFSRSFKQRYGIPPSVFDVETFRKQRRREFETVTDDPELRYRLKRLPEGSNPDGFSVRMHQRPARTVAYIRTTDPFRPGVVELAADRLVKWAEARGLADGQWLGYMWEDPEIVAVEDCRYDVGLEVPDLESDGEVGRIRFSAMLVAEVEVCGPIDLEQRALDWLYGTWLPRSCYVPADQPCFEAWIGRPFAHGSEHFELFVHLPVTRG